MEVAINKCFGGFDLSDEAYEEMIKMGIPAIKYIKEERNPKTGLYDLNENGDELVIYDNTLGDEDNMFIFGRYWETWTRSYENRTNPILIKAIKKLGKKASGRLGEIKIVKIPDGIEWDIDEYNGIETVHEKHRSW